MRAVDICFFPAFHQQLATFWLVTSAYPSQNAAPISTKRYNDRNDWGQKRLKRSAGDSRPCMRFLLYSSASDSASRSYTVEAGIAEG